MAEQVGGRYRPLAGAMLLALLVGALAGFWANLDQGYRYGAAGGRIAPLGWAPSNVMILFGSEPWNRMGGWLSQGPRPEEQHRQAIALGAGCAVTWILNGLRLRFCGFPFHPVGYAISGSWSLGMLWLPLLLAWIIKSLLLRYGGLRAYRRAVPFFFGVILGECLLGSLWTLVGIALDIPTYSFWP